MARLHPAVREKVEHEKPLEHSYVSSAEYAL